MRVLEPWVAAPLTEFLRESSARLVLIMTSSGQVIAQHGFTRSLDVMAAAALGAGILATTTELAHMLEARTGFGAVVHQSARQGVWLAGFDTPRGRWIGLAVFGPESSVGLVRLFFGRFAEQVTAATPPLVPMRDVLAEGFERELDDSLRALFGEQLIVARIDEAAKDLTLTVVIYGAPRSGKTAVLHCIRERVAPDRHGALAPLGSDLGGTPLLDWLPLELGVISGWNARVNLYAIPDQRHADITRRVILADADGVLFAADSQAGRIAENGVALASLRGNLGDAEGHVRDVPTIFLYTKQDLPPELLLSRTALDQELNRHDVPSFAVSALRGEGVLEALHATISMAMRRLVGKKAPAA